jgi:hypothetical protein
LQAHLSLLKPTMWPNNWPLNGKTTRITIERVVLHLRKRPWRGRDMHQDEKTNSVMHLIRLEKEIAGES